MFDDFPRFAALVQPANAGKQEPLGQRVGGRHGHDVGRAGYGQGADPNAQGASRQDNAATGQRSQRLLMQRGDFALKRVLVGDLSAAAGLR